VTSERERQWICSVGARDNSRSGNLRCAGDTPDPGHKNTCTHDPAKILSHPGKIERALAYTIPKVALKMGPRERTHARPEDELAWATPVWAKLGTAFQKQPCSWATGQETRKIGPKINCILTRGSIYRSKRRNSSSTLSELQHGSKLLSKDKVYHAGSRLKKTIHCVHAYRAHDTLTTRGERFASLISSQSQ